jgi:hypothetical protein
MFENKLHINVNVIHVNVEDPEELIAKGLSVVDFLPDQSFWPMMGAICLCLLDVKCFILSHFAWNLYQ